MNSSQPPQLVLIHSPLVGPTFWQPTARVLEEHGWKCHTPTVPPASSSDTEVAPWSTWPQQLSENLPNSEAAVLIGHSAADSLLPALARHLEASALVFVDADIPPAAGVARPVSAEFLDFVRTLPITDDRLPPWSKWWSEGEMERLMPDNATRIQFKHALPQLRLRWFEDEVEVPKWDTISAGYVQLSNWFSPTAKDAEAHAWPVKVLRGNHIFPLSNPQETADAISQIVEAILSR